MSLAGLARETRTIQLGTLVSPVTFRNPGLLARTAATVHEMSDGRAEVGMGAGWYVREHEAFGLPLPPWPEQFDLLEEQLGIVRRLLTGEHVRERLRTTRSTRRSVRTSTADNRRRSSSAARASLARSPLRHASATSSTSTRSPTPTPFVPRSFAWMPPWTESAGRATPSCARPSCRFPMTSGRPRTRSRRCRARASSASTCGEPRTCRSIASRPSPGASSPDPSSRGGAEPRDRPAVSPTLPAHLGRGRPPQPAVEVVVHSRRGCRQLREGSARETTC